MSPAAHAQRSGLRILVVDDNTDTTESMAKLLAIFGHEVRIARDGPGAIEAALTWRPEFVLLDIGLPGVDGYEVASRLRRAASCRDTVIIAVTGYGQPEDRQRSAAAGIDHHLLKPAVWDQLLSLLSRRGSTSDGDGSSSGGADLDAADSAEGGPSTGAGEVSLV
jgi:CheY-like chemotaxis protein